MIVQRSGAECASIALYHLALDSTRTLCARWPGPINVENQAEVLEQIEERALRQANVLGGSHAFHLEAVDAQKQILMTEVFRVSAESLPGATGMLATEPANEAGAFAQLMRHNEVLFRLSTDAWRGANYVVAEQLRRQDAQLQAFELERANMLRIERETYTERMQHERDMAKQKRNAELQDQVFKQLQAIAPEVLALIREKKVGDVEGAAAVGFKGLVETLRPDQMTKIFDALEPGQQVTLMNAIKRIAAASNAKVEPNAPPS